MIGTMLRMSMISLRRDYVVLGLTFALPIAFFSIFALIFGGAGGRNQTPAVAVAIADEDQSEASRRLVASLQSDASLKVQTLADAKAKTPMTRAVASAAVHSGRLSVAIIIPKRFGESFPDFSGTGPEIEVLVDRADPIAPQMVAGLLQKAAMTSAPDLMMRGGLQTLEQFGGTMTERQRELIDEFSKMMRKDKPEADGKGAAGTAGSKPAVAEAASFGLVRTKMIDAVGDAPEGADGEEPEEKSLIGYQAAATAVMFLLFMASGAGGALLDEQESGTLERLLSSRLSMTQLLGSKWLFVTLLGVVQVTVMFLWGAAFFGLKLFTAKHLAGFAVMTVATAGAAAAFGLVLATLCKSRGQLGGISTIVILMMSALGGSMIPRFLMSESMQRIGYATFNAWALDGYRKVFRYGASITELGPQVGVLVGLAVVFFVAARTLARRWETV